MSEHGIKHERSQALINYAYEYAKEAHGDQKRKYTDEPYIIHPVAVAKIVASVTEDCEMICAALLHDVVEDTDRTLKDIKDNFGYTIAKLVEELTDISKPEDGNRRTRKTIDRDHIADASVRGKTVKLANLIHNSESIQQYDTDFSVVYFREVGLLLGVLSDGDVSLWQQLYRINMDYHLHYKNRK